MRFYHTLDELPIHNWWMLHSSGDLKYLLRTDITIPIHNDPELINTWENLNDDYIEMFGFNEDYLRLIEMKEQYIRDRIDGWTNKDLNKEMQADLLGLRIDREENPDEVQIENNELLNILEKHKGYRIDTKTVSVTEFHNSLNFILKPHGQAENN